MPRKGLSLVAATLVALLAALLAATPCKSEEDAFGGETLGPLSPVVVSLVSQQAIAPVLGSDGRYHVLYELEMLNTLGAPADLRSVEVLDADDGKTLLALSADIIKGEYLHTLDRQTAETTSFAAQQGCVLILNLSFDSKDSIPSELTHRFQVSGADPFNRQPTMAAGRSKFPSLRCLRRRSKAEAGLPLTAVAGRRDISTRWSAWRERSRERSASPSTGSKSMPTATSLPATRPNRPIRSATAPRCSRQLPAW